MRDVLQGHKTRVAGNKILRFLLIGPYDPSCGEYTFLAPPLGVWRLCGHLRHLGHHADVFDPNCCDGDPPTALTTLLQHESYDVIGVSTTGMTLRHDLGLAHLIRRIRPDSLLIAGGMEATFNPGLVSRLGTFDLIILGDGEKPMTELANRLLAGETLIGIQSTAVIMNTGMLQKFHGRAMDYQELKTAIQRTPYELMPYREYWTRLETAYRLHNLPEKASREARLAEVRAVRISTLNYCPMACTFCSSTNFLHAAQGSVAKVARLSAEDCLEMIDNVVSAHPDVRTIIFQDDIFVFTADKRIEPLCNSIIHQKAVGNLPQDLQFISTNRIDAMTYDRLALMKRAGFRVLGFGVENFSKDILKEFNKAQIYNHIQPNLTAALELGVTPFLDLILCSPGSELHHVAMNVIHAYQWISRGCEVGLYPYVIPFSGSAMARDTELLAYTETEVQHIPGTSISWEQPARILPIDNATREAVLEIESGFHSRLDILQRAVEHLPSRVRSLLWIQAALPVLSKRGYDIPNGMNIQSRINNHLGIPQSYGIELATGT